MFDGLRDYTHLLGIETGEPRVLGNLILDESNRKPAVDLHGRLTLVTTVEPRLRPPTLTGIVRINGGNPVYIEILDVYL